MVDEYKTTNENSLIPPKTFPSENKMLHCMKQPKCILCYGHVCLARANTYFKTGHSSCLELKEDKALARL